MKNAIILLLLIAACGPKNEGPNKFSDEKLINIYELQDRRDNKALLPFLKAKKESHRIAAAMAFASIQDTIAIPYLNQMLQIDQDPMPRRAAAYALGQIGSTKARGILIKAFDQELFPA
ncbi:MAG: HEAT repeat protein, partial [Bacteroidia bacterium]